MRGLVFLFCMVLGTHSAERLVQLFEWRFDDIARECEDFLGKNGYTGVQVSPVTECPMLGGRPWWERYQPFSYKIISRSGDERAFKNMCDRCSKAGVGIIVDVLLNHMSTNTPLGTVGTGGAIPTPTNKSYPAVPYTAEHFHPTCQITDYNNATNLANAFMLGWSYGHSKKVMSSYQFTTTDDGPPHNDDMSIKNVTISSEGVCGNGWICEHRWPEIAAMVRFAKAVEGELVCFADFNLFYCPSFEPRLRRSISNEHFLSCEYFESFLYRRFGIVGFRGSLPQHDFFPKDGKRIRPSQC
ncbi:unnamed protein product [Nesidiocoris tenuis]|uniref:alpha-amylase n=1 Tax=Nesidiocoris tenuis TaxID=355587 RepID=A0A6H5HML6_9HEMI|nr:unnamed protein product [Nesidiocoris tenuis]